MDATALAEEARAWARSAPMLGKSVTRELDLGIILARKLADALETLQTDLDARFEHSDHLSAKYYQRMRAAEREMHARELHHFEEEQKSAGLAAVIEKAQQAGEVTGYSHHKEPVMKALSAAPVDVLREHDRQVAERAWDEGYGPDEECHTPRRNPYRKEQENNNA